MVYLLDYLYYLFIISILLFYHVQHHLINIVLVIKKGRFGYGPGLNGELGIIAKKLIGAVVISIN